MNPTRPRPPARLLVAGKGAIWRGVAFPAWCVTNVAQSTIFAPFSCSINWFLIFHVHCVGLAFDTVQDTAAVVGQWERNPLAATGGQGTRGQVNIPKESSGTARTCIMQRERGVSQRSAIGWGTQRHDCYSLGALRGCSQAEIGFSVVPRHCLITPVSAYCLR